MEDDSPVQTSHASRLKVPVVDPVHCLGISYATPSNKQVKKRNAGHSVRVFAYLRGSMNRFFDNPNLVKDTISQLHSLRYDSVSSPQCVSRKGVFRVGESTTQTPRSK